MAVEYEDLLPFKWRDDGYPCSRIRLSLAHDLVEHKYWGVDGARVEATGVAPVRISADIPFNNNVFPAKSETWRAGELYPTALRKFIVDFAKKTAGLLQHPEFGRIACKPERLEFEMTPDRRDGPMLQASWVETLDDDVITEIVTRPINLELEAASLDASMADIKKLVPGMPEYEEDFEDFARSIQAIGDQVTLLSQREAGKIDRIRYRADQVQASIERAKSALTWPATQKVERIKAATNNIRQTLLQARGRDLQIYTVPAETTLAGVMTALPASTKLAELIKLNPDLVAEPVVPVGTRVRHYVERVAA